MKIGHISRRDFIKLSIGAIGSLAFSPWLGWMEAQKDFPDADKLGRVCQGKVFVRSRPYVNANVVKEIYDDEVVVWLRDVVGENPGVGSSTWAETPDGYIYAPRLQPCKVKLNAPVNTLPETSMGKGMWVEATVPYVEMQVTNPSMSLQNGEKSRLYYNQVVWVDDLKTGEDGKVYYRVHEKYGYGAMFWAAGEAFRPLTDDDLSPISPDVSTKKIIVDLSHQTLSAYEDKHEVFFCRISSGGKFDKDGNPSDKWSTPLGQHPIYRKLISLYMSGPITGNWPGVAWTSLITGEGVAVHSTYWHNEFGVPRSHGCINVSPENAKWIFRWTIPNVSADPGEVDVHTAWPPVGTVVEVIE
jgi:lipoprotein-anchoring transpeptidase ErfK/SrfK